MKGADILPRKIFPHLFMLPEQVSVLLLEQSVASLEVVDMATEIVENRVESLGLGDKMLNLAGILGLSSSYLLHLRVR